MLRKTLCGTPRLDPVYLSPHGQQIALRHTGHFVVAERKDGCCYLGPQPAMSFIFADCRPQLAVAQDTCA